MLPDKSVLIGQKLVENAKIEKFKCDILDDFQTLCKAEKSLTSSMNPDKHPLLKSLPESHNRTTKETLGPSW